MKTKALKITEPTIVGGKIARKGELVEVTTREAHDLIARGRAVEHGDDTAPEGEQRPARKPKAKAKGEGGADGDGGAEGGE